jgi:dihydrolipoamide dehydrogenase
VTVIEMLDKIAGPTDGEISGLLQKHYEKRGVKFLLGARLTRIGGNFVTYEQGGQAVELPCDKVLLSIGRRAVSGGFGLEKLGVETQRGAVRTDAQQKTNGPGVFAAGDINGTSMLAHTAYREAEVAINTLCGRKDSMSYDAIPSVIYTNPEVACIGETLESAKAKGLDAREVKLPMMYSGRYMAENEGGTGICKLVWAGKRLIGVHMLGNPASEIISTASALISREISLEQAKRIVFPHPSVAEILHEGLFHA